jgi:hypothetical protein
MACRKHSGLAPCAVGRLSAQALEGQALEGQALEGQARS